MVEKSTAQVLREKKNAIVAEFEKNARKNIARVRSMESAPLVNHIPDFIETIISHLDTNQQKEEEFSIDKKTARTHGANRSKLRGYGVENLLAEYRQLRIALFRCLESEIQVPKNDRDIILDIIQIGAKQAMLQFIYEKSATTGILKYVPNTTAMRYLVSVVLVSTSTILQLTLLPYTGPAPYIIYYPAILIASIFGDGIVATVLTALCVQYFFVEPYNSLSMGWPMDFARTGLFFIFSGLMILVSRMLRRATANASIAAEEQQLATIELEETVRKLHEEKGMREQFVASLTHDLRGPLTSIRISAQHLLRKQKIESPERIYQRIINSAERADEMIQDLLDVSLIRSGQNIPVSFEYCNLNEIILDVLEEFRLMYGDRFKLICNESFSGFWSYNGLKRVFENLITNAVKYGAVDAPIIIYLSRDNNSVHIEVQNSLLGKPLTEEEIKNLFEPFQRLKRAKASGKAGWGLGLTLVKGLIQSHCGTIELKSSEKSGTIFIITLPFDPRK